ncbi:c-type cytochrome [Frateuria sp. YIM B11624]|uniref:c-type cytochrome n=1 Tax=Frateuria sp. YIM B11624 TaxID=3143185 RepID=UPI003C788E90
MRNSGLEGIVVGVWLALACASPAEAATPQTLVSQGNGHGAPPCQSCHGADGGGQATAGFPRLAGLDADYLRRQLGDYARGTRANAVMQPIAKALSTDERGTVAAYYARLPVPAKAPAAKPADRPADDTGATLATRGRWSARVPACEQCHGPGGVGVGANFPPLAGQPAAYIETQLKAWQQGTRRNDPLELMQHLSRALSAQDIAAVAQWFAAQPTGSGHE